MNICTSIAEFEAGSKGVGQFQTMWQQNKIDDAILKEVQRTVKSAGGCPSWSGDRWTIEELLRRSRIPPMGHTKKNRKPVSDLTPEELREELDRCRTVADLTPNAQVRKSLEKRIREIEESLATRS